MTLFNYEHCKICRRKNKDIKTEPSKVLPVNVCNLVGGYNIRCYKCWSLHLKEIEFMTNKDLPDEGLEKAELHLDFLGK